MIDVNITVLKNKVVTKLHKGKWLLGVTRNRHFNGTWKVVVNRFNPYTYEESWTEFYEDANMWSPLSDDHMMSKFVKFFDILYDADLEIDASCTNSRCDGYDTEIGEWYVNNRSELFKEVWELFNK